MCLLFQCNDPPGSIRFQRNPCRRSVLCIYNLKCLVLICGGDKSNHTRKTCSAQAEEMLRVYMMPTRKKPCYPQRQSSNICGPNSSVRELKLFQFLKRFEKDFTDLSAHPPTQQVTSDFPSSPQNEILPATAVPAALPATARVPPSRVFVPASRCSPHFAAKQLEADGRNTKPFSL